MIWRFILNNSDGNSYILAEEPKGWSDIVLHVKRDEATHGVFFEFSETSLTFYGLPADLLEQGFELYGVDNNVTLEVLMSCDGGAKFEDFYKGRLMFTKYKKVCGDLCSVTIPAEQADEVMTFRNRLATKVDLDSLFCIDGNTLTNYTHLNTLKDLPSKGIEKYTEWNKCESDVFPTAATVAVNSKLDCVVLRKVVPYGNPATTDTVTHTRYWTVDMDCMQRDEIDTFSGIGDVVGSYDDITPIIIADESGTYNIDFEIKGEVHGFAETSALDIDWNTSPAPLVYNFGYKELKYNVHFEVGGVDTILATGSTTTNCHYSTTLPCSNAHLAVTNGVYPAASANDNFDGFGIYAPAKLTFNVSHQATVAVNKGDKIRVYVEVIQEGEYYHHIVFRKDVSFGQCVFIESTEANPSYFKADYISYFDTTKTRAYFINETFARIAESITNNKLTVLSDYYGRTDSQPYAVAADGCNSLLFLTNGLMVRNQKIQGEHPKLMLSFSEVFNAMNCIDNIGMGLEADTTKADGSYLLRIEPVEYFYDSNTVLLQCLNIQEVERTVLENRIFSVVKFGYDKYEAEEYTGIDEFLSQREYTTKIQSVKTQDNKLCKFVASGYAIEITRRKGNVDTKDWRFDNDTFVVCCKRNGAAIEVEQGVSNSAKIVDPTTVYNYRISPIHNAFKWMKTWVAGIVNWTNSVLSFTSGTGNYFAEGEYVGYCNHDAGVVNENGDITTALIDLASNAKPLWQPEEIKFTYPLSYSDYLNIRTNAKGVIEYQCGGGVIEKGFIIDIEYKPNDGLANFTLLKAKA